MDSALKFEILLTSFHNMMKYTCFLEGVIITIMACLFLRSPMAMWFYFLHVPHMARVLIGLDLS